MNISELLKKTISIVIIAVSALGVTCFADNPIIQTKYTADPAPMVYNDTVFLYAGHDEDDATGFKMLNWQLYTSTDMVNWTDHGMAASLKMFSWATDNGAWAPQCVARNGKFYMYCPVNRKIGSMGIGVAVSDSPYGPFTDALSKPLIENNSTGDFDPTVFIDDDGQAYMYWGNPDCFYVKLNEDMISYSGSIVKINSRPANYQEGPWFYKRQGHYYLAYASTCCPEGIGYAMSNSPIGPWVYKGMIMDPNGLSSGNHPGIIDYKGNSYVFGFDYALLWAKFTTHYERRSICVDKITYNADGTIQKLPFWSTAGTAQLGTLNPYSRTEAECIAWASGVKTEKSNIAGVYVTDIDNGDYIKVKGVDFGSTGAGMYSVNAACGNRLGVREGGTIELHLDSVNGSQIGVTPVSYTGGKDVWRKKSISISGASGKHDLYLVFKGNARTDLFNADYWKFEEKTTGHTLAAINAYVDNYKIDTISGFNTARLKVMAVYSDGISEDITDSAAIMPNQAGIVTIGNGVITGVSYGSVSINVSYKGINETLNMLVNRLKNELTLRRITSSIGSSTLFPGNELPYTITAEYYDGHTEDITNIATYVNSDSTIGVMSHGILKATSIGTTTIAISFMGEMGMALTTRINLIVVGRSPYFRFEAENWSEQSGVGTENSGDTNGGIDVGFIENGDWIKVNSLDFANGAKTFDARVASAGSGGTIELRLDSKTGKLIGTCIVPVTGGWQTWITKSCAVSGVTGAHDLYLLFKGTSGFLFNLNWWMFTAITTGIDEKVADKNLPYIKVENGQSWLIGTQNGYNISMYDVSGKNVFHGLATSSQFLLPKVQCGIYIVKVETGKETITLKGTIY